MTWGTNPGMVTEVTGQVPDPDRMPTQGEKQAVEHALDIYGPESRLTPIEEIQIDKVFIGSCTNSRIDDLRVAAEVAKGRKVAPTVNALVVPGSQAVKRQAEAEGLDEVFRQAGFEWRESGCSMCLGMNPGYPNARRAVCEHVGTEILRADRAREARTHLVSPQMAAGAAIAGRFVDIRKWE